MPLKLVERESESPGYGAALPILDAYRCEFRPWRWSGRWQPPALTGPEAGRLEPDEVGDYCRPLSRRSAPAELRRGRQTSLVRLHPQFKAYCAFPQHAPVHVRRRLSTSKHSKQAHHNTFLSADRTNVRQQEAGDLALDQEVLLSSSASASVAGSPSCVNIVLKMSACGKIGTPTSDTNARSLLLSSSSVHG